VILLRINEKKICEFIENSKIRLSIEDLRKTIEDSFNTIEKTDMTTEEKLTCYNNQFIFVLSGIFGGMEEKNIRFIVDLYLKTRNIILKQGFKTKEEVKNFFQDKKFVTIDITESSEEKPDYFG